MAPVLAQRGAVKRAFEGGGPGGPKFLIKRMLNSLLANRFGVEI